MEILHISNRVLLRIGGLDHPGAQGPMDTPWRRYTLIEAPENVVTGNRKCLLPWEEVSNRTESFFNFSEILPVICFSTGTADKRRLSARQCCSSVLPSFESQHGCCTQGICFIFWFDQTCGEEGREWRWVGQPLSLSRRSSKPLLAAYIRTCLGNEHSNTHMYCISSHSPSNWSFSRHYRVMTQRAADNLRTCL